MTYIFSWMLESLSFFFFSNSSLFTYLWIYHMWHVESLIPQTRIGTRITHIGRCTHCTTGEIHRGPFEATFRMTVECGACMTQGQITLGVEPWPCQVHVTTSLFLVQSNQDSSSMLISLVFSHSFGVNLLRINTQFKSCDFICLKSCDLSFRLRIIYTATILLYLL